MADEWRSGSVEERLEHSLVKVSEGHESVEPCHKKAP